MTESEETKYELGNPSKPMADDVLTCLRKIIQSHYLYSHFLLKRVGLTGSQLAVLQEIHKKKEPTVGEIAKAIILSQATVTGILERLENRDLVTRKRTPVDRRKVFVNLTPKGMQLLNDAPPLLRESFVSDFNELQDWEKSMILSSLQRLVQMMDAKSVKPGPILSDESLNTLVNPSIVR